ESMSLAFFFFSSRRRHTRFSRDWSSDVCSSDLSSVTTNRCMPSLVPYCSKNKNNLRQNTASPNGYGRSSCQSLKVKSRILISLRSEERRVGKEGGAGGAPDDGDKGQSRRATQAV